MPDEPIREWRFDRDLEGTFAEDLELEGLRRDEWTLLEAVEGAQRSDRAE